MDFIKIFYEYFSKTTREPKIVINIFFSETKRSKILNYFLNNIKPKIMNLKDIFPRTNWQISWIFKKIFLQRPSGQKSWIWKEYSPKEQNKKFWLDIFKFFLKILLFDVPITIKIIFLKKKKNDSMHLESD